MTLVFRNQHYAANSLYRHRQVPAPSAPPSSSQAMVPGAGGGAQLYSKILSSDVQSYYESTASAIMNDRWQYVLDDLKGLQGGDRPQFTEPERLLLNDFTKDQITVAAMLSASRNLYNRKICPYRSLIPGLELFINGRYMPIMWGMFGKSQPPTTEDANAAWQVLNPVRMEVPAGLAGALDAYSKFGPTLSMQQWRDAVWEMHPPVLKSYELPWFSQASGISGLNSYNRDQITVAAMLKASRCGENITLPLANYENNCVQVTPGRFGTGEPPTQADADAAWQTLSWIAPHWEGECPATFKFDRNFLEGYGSYALTAASDIRYATSLFGRPERMKSDGTGQYETVNPKVYVKAVPYSREVTDFGTDETLARVDRSSAGMMITFNANFIKDDRFYMDDDPTTYKPGDISGNKMDLVTLAAHEFGHNLDLKHYEAGSLMKTNGGFGQRRVPGELDAQALEKLGYRWPHADRPSGSGDLG